MAVTTTKTVAVTGNQAVAEAFRQLNPDVMPAYPITPSTGETLPRNSTRCAIPESRTKRSATGRSGPSPTIARCANEHRSN